MTRFENLPPALRSLPRFVCAGAGSKRPMQAGSDRPASTADPSSWTTFEKARAAVERGKYDYAGFVFAGDGIVGIDIDRGVDEEGFITPSAADIIGRCRSYTERSKSGRGFHILLKGELPFKGKNNLAGVEIYKDARYFILTGDVLVYRTLEENQAAIDEVVAAYFPDAPRESGGPVGERFYRPVWPMPEGGRVPLRPSYPHIACGGRNTSLTSLAGVMRWEGYTEEQILRELERANAEACDPPLDGRELRTIAASVMRYTR